MIPTGAHKPERSRRQDHPLGRSDERRLRLRSRCRALEVNQVADEDNHACHPTGDGVWLLHHRIHQAKELLSVVAAFILSTTDFRF